MLPESTTSCSCPAGRVAVLRLQLAATFRRLNAHCDRLKCCGNLLSLPHYLNNIGRRRYWHHIVEAVFYSTRYDAVLKGDIILYL
jgi:hypothetical protein